MKAMQLIEKISCALLNSTTKYLKVHKRCRLNFCYNQVLLYLRQIDFKAQHTCYVNDYLKINTTISTTNIHI
jgi:hypothetical protein